MQQHLWCVKNEATCDMLYSKRVSNIIFKSELESSNPLLYTSLLLLGFFPTFNLIAPSCYDDWCSPLFLHWVMSCCNLSVFPGFFPALNSWWLQVLIIIGLPSYFRNSYIGVSLLLGFFPAFKLVFHTTYHSIVFLLWIFGTCYLPIDLMKSLCQAVICIIRWFWNTHWLPWSLYRPQN